MKKLSIFLLGAFAMAFTACDEAPEAPQMQANPQEPILTEGKITGAAAGALAVQETLALETAPQSIGVFTITEQKDLPAGAIVKPVFEIAGGEDFSKSKTLDMTAGIDGVYTVNANEWNEAHLALFGKSPKEKTAYYRIPVYVDYAGTEYRYNGPEWYAVQGIVKETCKDAGFVIYDAYYFLGNATTWDLSDANMPSFKFKHSAADVYDDPVFTFNVVVSQDVLDANGGGCYWKIASQKAVDGNDWNFVYGPEIDGDEELSGLLVGDGAAQAGKITAAGKYTVTVNMEAMTYDIVPVTRPDWIAVPSNANGWNDSGSRLYWSNKDDKPYFCGAARVNNFDGGFKFIWDGKWFGGSDGVIDAAGGNIPAPNDANTLYWFTVSTDDMTYNMTEITSLGVIGDMNGWGGQEALTPDESLLVWTGDVNLTGNWKIRMNDNWDMNYGGADLAHPVFDGDNISGFEGLHTVTVDFTGNNPVITCVAK